MRAKIGGVGVEQRRGLAIFGVVVVIAGLFPFAMVGTPVRGVAYTSHAPIVIIGDRDFSADHGVIRGSGVDSDPYAIEGWDIDASNSDGISISNTRASFVIHNVYVHGAGHNGIFIRNASSGQVNGAVISGTDTGLLLAGDVRMFVYNNQITGAVGDGVLGYGLGLIIGNNTVSGNGADGIHLSGADTGVINGNIIASNGRYGVELIETSGISVRYNNFISNFRQALDDISSALWAPNYWSDYTGVDNCIGSYDCTGPDGFGDTPYYGYGVTDPHPLMNPWPYSVFVERFPPEVLITSPTSGEVVTSPGILATGTASDTGGSGLMVVEARLNGGPWVPVEGLVTWSIEVTLEPGANVLEAQATDWAGNPSALASVSVTYAPPINLQLAANPSTGAQPLTVSFSSTITGGLAPFAYLWDFGDGSSSQDPNPMHTYPCAGDYAATLSVTDSLGSQGRSLVSIHVTSTLQVQVTVGTHGLTAEFQASASGGVGPFTYQWDFGDGSKASGATVVHRYRRPGTYVVTLDFQDGCGHSFWSLNIRVP